MQHDITLTGKAFSLRPVTDADAQVIIDLRTDPALNVFLNSTSPDLAQQLAWLQGYYNRPHDYYFAIVRNGHEPPEGFISIYNIDTDSKAGEWGRWIIRRGSLAAVESAHLIYTCAFEQLGLSEIYCHTLAENTATVSFHDSCGLGTRHLLPAQTTVNGHLVDVVEHRTTAQEWPALDAHLGTLAARIAGRLTRTAGNAL